MGYNQEFNEVENLYKGIITKEEEKEYSLIIYDLYLKVKKAAFDKNVIIFTHMPLQDWSKDKKVQSGFVYVSGHNHRNYFYDDGIKRIYSDNQIGYSKKSIFMKHFSIDNNYDWFSDYEDGIYEISREDYEWFYRGIQEGMEFNQTYQNLYMIKRSGIYLFLARNKKDKLLVLNGGRPLSVGDYSLEYFYENMEKYSESIKMYLSEYTEYQNKISKELKSIGCTGKIHGCIIDIDYFNHIYINPIDGKITPYYATSIIDKHIYNNFASLLKNKCPSIYLNYEKKYKDDKKYELVNLMNQDIVISDSFVIEYDTSIYNVSRIIKGLQFTAKYNVIRLWNPRLVYEASSQNGKLIVTSIINPSVRLETEDNYIEMAIQANNNYEQLNNSSELKSGDKIIHKNFGEGTIIDISNKKSTIIKFKKMEKILNMEYAVANGYISIEKKESD